MFVSRKNRPDGLTTFIHSVIVWPSFCNFAHCFLLPVAAHQPEGDDDEEGGKDKPSGGVVTH